MAHMSCYCGASMSNVICPSENTIYVISKKQVDAALNYNSNIKLSDFVTNWDELKDSKKEFLSEEFDFWYCTHCKRVYQCEIQIGGNKLASYKPIDDFPSVEIYNLLDMMELIVFTDIEEYNATEKDSNITLAEFLKSLPNTRYFISDNQQFVYAFNCNTEEISFVYQSENPIDSK